MRAINLLIEDFSPCLSHILDEHCVSSYCFFRTCLVLLNFRDLVCLSFGIRKMHFSVMFPRCVNSQAKKAALFFLLGNVYFSEFRRVVLHYSVPEWRMREVFKEAVFHMILEVGHVVIFSKLTFCCCSSGLEKG